MLNHPGGDLRLDGKTFTVEHGRGGAVEIRGAGPEDRLIASQGEEEYPAVAIVSPEWPLIYFYFPTEAAAYVAMRGGRYLVRNDKLVHVRWFVGAEPELAFADLFDVMLYASVTDFGRS